MSTRGLRPQVMRGQFAAAAGSADKTFEDRFVEAL